MAFAFLSAIVPAVKAAIGSAAGSKAAGTAAVGAARVAGQAAGGGLVGGFKRFFGGGSDQIRDAERRAEEAEARAAKLETRVEVAEAHASESEKRAEVAEAHVAELDLALTRESDRRLLILRFVLPLGILISLSIGLFVGWFFIP